MKKSSLGRGLGVLFQEAGVAEEAQQQPVAATPTVLPENAVVDLPLGQIDPNREQPRKRFDEEALQQLSDSIRQSGVIQPIIVFPNEGRYTIVAGERRWRASRMAGLDVIPAIVRTYDRVKQMEVSLIENIQREDLNPLEEAAAVRRLMDECGLTQELVATRLGRSRPAVANLLRILSLSEPVQALVRDGALTAGHARALAGVEGVARQRALAEQAIHQGWSVRQLEVAVQRSNKKSAKVRDYIQPVELSDLEETLRRALGMRATVTGTPKKGRIVLSYASMEELESLLSAMNHWIDR